MNEDLQIRLYNEGDEAGISGLFSACYGGREFPLQYWKWRFRDAPAGQGVIVLAWDGERMAAHYAVTPVTLWVGGQKCGTGLSGTTMTHSDYRGRRLFPILAEQTYELMHQRGLEMVWGFPNDLSHRGIIKDIRWTDISEVPTFRLHLPSGRLKLRPAEAVDEIEELGSDFDELWAAARERYSVIALRDRATLTWRYRFNPVDIYRFIAARRDGELAGYAVLKQYGDELHITDYLARDLDADLELMHKAIHIALEESRTAVSLWLNCNLPLHRELERLGFVNEERITYFGGRLLGDGLGGAGMYDYRSWYLTMGDSDVY